MIPIIAGVLTCVIPSYMEGMSSGNRQSVTLNESTPFMTEVYQSDWIARWALYRPDHIAVEEAETGRLLTYAQLDRTGNALSAHLVMDHGLEKGDRIVILADHCLDYVVFFAAAQKTGTVLVPLNYRLAAPEIAYLIENADPKLIIVEDHYRHLLDAMPADHHRQIFPLSAPRRLIEAHKDTPGEPFPAVQVFEDDPLFILYTSGTTGFPKGAIYSWKMLIWNSFNTAISLILNSESRTINCMPPFHTGGWNVLLTPFLHHGAYVCLMKKFDAGSVLTLLEEKKSTIFMAVPTMLKMIADQPGFSEADFSALLYLIVGGEPMPIPLIETWDRQGVPVRQGYGLTEVGPNLFSLHQDDAMTKKGSIGRSNFYVQTRIVDEAGNDCPVNHPGELLLKGPMVTPGYWRNEEATQKNISDGWFHTGDIVREDEDHYFYVVDRIKNMFISGGENVYPAEIERILITHPDVASCAVIGVPDERWGEVGFAFIQGKNPDSDLASIEAYCQSQLARFKVPKYFRQLDEIPKNDTGKVDKRLLEQWADRS